MFKTVSLIIAASLILLYTIIIPPLMLFAAIFGGIFIQMFLYGMFCTQLFAQGVVMIIQAKRTALAIQRLIAAGLILLLPLLLLVIVVPIVSQTRGLAPLSGDVGNWVFMGLLVAHVVGSIWMWVLIVRLQRLGRSSQQQSTVVSTPAAPEWRS